MQITHHTQLLNALIEKYGLKSYLEIGINDPRANFNLINCEMKYGVDPNCEWTNDISNVTSDAFFERYFSRVNNRTIFDLIFIDGLHTAEQVKKDFENSLRCLSDNGFIVIHDVLPENEEGTRVPRKTKQWWGDVYKWAMRIGEYEGIDYKTFNIDNGCMLIWKGEGRKDRSISIGWQYDYSTFQLYGHKLMNVTDEVEI